MRYEARAPLRIDFGGGWTDIPLFAEAEEGIVLNAAITRYVRGTISRPSSTGILSRLRSDQSRLAYALDVPSGAGLGASAAQTVLWATLVRTMVSNTAERADIAEIACRIAETLGILGGKQDEYASALGGINFLRFGDSVSVERLALTPHVLTELQRRLTLVYSGERRYSSDVHAHVWRAYRSGDQEIIRTLRALKEVATEQRDALLQGDLDRFAGLLGENWAQQRRLHPEVSTDTLDRLIAMGRLHGVQGAKVCGAGGGGCVLFMSPAERVHELRSALVERRVKVIDFAFDTYGVFLKKA